MRADNTVALVKLSSIQLSLGEIPESLKSIKECLKFDPDHKVCKKSFRRLKKLDKGLNRIDELGGASKWKDVVAEIHGSSSSSSSLSEDDNSGILSEIDDLKVEGNVRKNLYLWTCKAYAGMGPQHVDKALQWCTRTLELDENNNDALNTRAEIKMQQEEFEDAMRDFKKSFDNGGNAKVRRNKIIILTLFDFLLSLHPYFRLKRDTTRLKGCTGRLVGKTITRFSALTSRHPNGILKKLGENLHKNGIPTSTLPCTLMCLVILLSRR